MLNEVIMPTGQIAIPEPILKILGVSNGDRIGFIIEKDSVRMVNPEIHAMNILQDEMKGEAEKANLTSEEDILKLVKDIRDESIYHIND